MRMPPLERTFGTSEMGGERTRYIAARGCYTVAPEENVTRQAPERDEEVETDADLAGRLVSSQFPQWSDLPLVRVVAASTDNDMYRLGRHLAARLPRRAGAVAPISKEHEWLPRLAPVLPVEIPVPQALGAPDLGYPFPWGIVRWIEGDTPPQSNAVAGPELARQLAIFLSTLHQIETADAPTPGAHNYWRGVPLRIRDAHLRQRFGWLSDLADLAAMIEVWEAGLAADRSREPVWIHGDLKAANLLVRDGALAGVLDWSCAAVGDRANDVAVAWTMFEGEARAAFRDALAIDTATWIRGRAWALLEGVLALSYYRGRNDDLAAEGRRVIDAVLATGEASG